MCGIAGKLCGTGAVDRELVERMCEVIEYRGPDSRGTYFDEGVGLGVQRLRVIDVETGDQPLYNEDRSVVVVLNGEIYNYQELRAELLERGHHFSTKSDTEVIVHLYEEVGIDCVHSLRGMFAFALWDRNERKLLLARDRLGKKPLMYAQRGESLWFASEPKAILQDPEIDRRPDFDAIDCYLQYQYVPHPLSAFEGISKLPPAHLLVWQDGKLDIERYWQLSYEPNTGISEHEAREEILTRLLESTRLRLRSDVPLGAFLSGGVDSSAVVAAMAMESSTPIRTFSIGFDVESFDETQYARTVATLFGTDHQELRIHPDAMEVLPRLVWHYGEPFADHSAIPSFYLADLTRSSVTVALNGDGGDENFAGYTRYAANAVVEHLGRLPRPLKRGLRQVGGMLGQPRADNGFVARVQRLTRAAMLDQCDRYPTWMSFFTELERDALYTPAFRDALPPRSAPSIIREPCRSSVARDPVNRLLDIDVQTYLPGDLLVKMDIATMAHSLEVRSPLLDHKFMEFAAGLPGKWKLAGGRTKAIFKDALAAWLPREVLERKKQGFGVPIGDWLSGELSDLPREILLDPIARSRGFFREQGIHRLIDDHVAGRRDNSNKIWALLQLELWFRTFVDGEAVGPLVLDVVQNRRRVAGVPA